MSGIAVDGGGNLFIFASPGQIDWPGTSRGNMRKVTPEGIIEGISVVVANAPHDGARPASPATARWSWPGAVIGLFALATLLAAKRKRSQ